MPLTKKGAKIKRGDGEDRDPQDREARSCGVQTLCPYL